MPKKCKYCGGVSPDDRTTCRFCGSALEANPIVNYAAPQSQQNAAPNRTKEPPEYDEWDFFCREDYAECWESFAAGGNAGILLTNTVGLAKADPIIEEFKRYIEARKPDVRYTILDLHTFAGEQDGTDCESIVEVLNEIYDIAVPSYLMIVGDGSVIPFMNWENECGDDDRFVPSDLPYITLNTESPWEGNDYAFDGGTKVGRVLASAVNGFENAVKYMRFAADYKPLRAVKPFAITAYAWIPTSKNVFGDMNCPILSSPNYTSNRSLAGSSGYEYIPDLDDRNLLGFNLHGSDATHDWYGQRGNSYPEGYDASCLPKTDDGYTICVEACYGARPAVKNGREQSIVVTALSEGCVAFVGSTRIAYGATSGGMCCADIIANTFLGDVMKGKTAGAAFLSALSDVADEGDDETCIKTLAEFALYGDPSIVPFASTKMSEFASGKSVKAKKVVTTSDRSRAIKLIPCDETAAKASNFSNYAFSNYAMERKQAERSLKTVNETASGFVAKNFSAFTNVRPMVFKVAGADSYRTVYQKTEGNVKTIVKLHVDGDGNVRKTYVSK